MPTCGMQSFGPEPMCLTAHVDKYSMLSCHNMHLMRLQWVKYLTRRLRRPMKFIF